MTRPPVKSKAKAPKAPPPWEKWNADHPELVCSVTNCVHNQQTVERRQTRAWQMLHQLGHSPSAFSADTLAAYADCPLAEAEANIEWAVTCKLIMHVGQVGKVKTYARHAKPQGMKAPSADAKRAKAFGQAAATLWSS